MPGEASVQTSDSASPASRRRFLSTAAGTLLCAGCTKARAERARIYTDWPAAQLAQQVGTAAIDVTRPWLFSRWQGLADVARDADLVVGWSALQFALAGSGHQAAWGSVDRLRWGVAGPGDAGRETARLDDLGSRAWRGRLILGDFTRDWAMHAMLCDQLLGGLDLRALYARWVRLYSSAIAVEPTSAAALARVRRIGNERDMTLCHEAAARAGGLKFAAFNEPLTTDFGVVLIDSEMPRAVAADLFRQCTINKPPADVPATIEQTRIFVSLALDLLEAAVIVAHTELAVAARALADAPGESNTRIDRAFVEPPPWRPAAVDHLLQKPQGTALVDALLSQVAPDAATHRWLAASWDREPEPLNTATLRELASACGGALAAGPRFRAWLRAEWTAWARQRFRRVARQARGGLAA